MSTIALGSDCSVYVPVSGGGHCVGRKLQKIYMQNFFDASPVVSGDKFTALYLTTVAENIYCIFKHEGEWSIQSENDQRCITPLTEGDLKLEMLEIGDIFIYADLTIYTSSIREMVALDCSVVHYDLPVGSVTMVDAPFRLVPK